MIGEVSPQTDADRSRRTVRRLRLQPERPVYPDTAKPGNIEAINRTVFFGDRRCCRVSNWITSLSRISGVA
jgi:hypothetical protein